MEKIDLIANYEGRMDKLLEEYDFKFAVWSQTEPKNLEEYMIRNNVQNCDLTFKNLDLHCVNCLYPVRTPTQYDKPFEIPFTGTVCNLCHALYTAVQGRKFFVDAHREHMESLARRKNDRK